MNLSLTKVLLRLLYRRNEKWFFALQARFGREIELQGLRHSEFDDPVRLFEFGRSLVSLDETRHAGNVELGLIPTEWDTIVESNKARLAFLCFRRAARMRYAPAQYRLSEVFHFGWMDVSKNLQQISIVPKNVSSSRRWMQAAAENGFALAQAALAETFSIEGNHKAATAWYLLAAEQGEPSAQNNLACMFARGEGVPKDIGKAKDWWLKAAEQNNINAQVAIGDLFHHGVAVEKNLETAKQWYQRAAALGCTDANKRLAKLAASSV